MTAPEPDVEAPPRLDVQEELDLMPVGIAHVRPDGTVLVANRMLGEMLGLDAHEVVGRNLFEFAVGDLDRYVEMIEFSTTLTGTILGPIAVEYRRSDGTVHHSSLWARNHLDDPRVGAFAATFVPEESESSVREALESVAEGEPVDATLALLAEAVSGNPFNADGCWLVRDAAGRRLAGHDGLRDAVQAALAQPGRWWRALRADDLVSCDDTRSGDDTDRLLAAAGVAAWWALPCRGDEEGEAAIIVLRSKPGGISPNQAEHLEQLTTTAALAFGRASLQARLAHAAFRDPLTGLANRGRFFQRSDDQLSAGAAILYLDLDRFKPVNDELGHTAGDLVLVTVADRIRRAVRPSDRISRFGGDEFVVECGGVASAEEAIVIAERILSSVGEPIQVEGAQVTVGVSIGIALASDATSVDELLDRSDAALLAAKAAGKGRWHLSG